MATISQNLQSLLRMERRYRLNLRQFFEENVTRSWLLTGWLAFLAYVTLQVAIGQLREQPFLTGAVLLVWFATLTWTVLNEVSRQHVHTTFWLKSNLYSSITNALLTLLLTLLVISFFRGFIGWAFVRASFTTDTAAAAERLAQFEEEGANWGAVIANLGQLAIYRYPRGEVTNLVAAVALLVVLAVPSVVVFRQARFRKSLLRRGLTLAWAVLPLVVWFLIRGIDYWRIGAMVAGVVVAYVIGSAVSGWAQPRGAVVRVGATVVWLLLFAGVAVMTANLTGGASTVRYDNWGGFLLTIVISVFAIAVSFPIGVVLALGRRSKIRGVPPWLTYLIAAGIMIWGLAVSTPAGLAAARTTSERLYAYWPLAVPVVAFLFQRYFTGNVVALFSTMYIEMVRGVPLITVLFMSVILFPIFLPPGVEVAATVRVMGAAALFSAAYLAENVRGGLQSIPHGQYEAADAIGLSTYQKYRLIILPQALRAVIPAIVGQFIGLFKDTTLVAIVGLTDMLGAANNIAAQPNWLGVRREPYVFIALIYFIVSAVMAGYSRRLERQLGVGER
jgi:general L-amino acid transport system permease protein